MSKPVEMEVFGQGGYNALRIAGFEGYCMCTMLLHHNGWAEISYSGVEITDPPVRCKPQRMPKNIFKTNKPK